MTTTTAPATVHVVITADTFRRIIGDLLAGHDRAVTGLWSDPVPAAVAFIDRARAALGMVDDDAFFGPSVDDDMLAAEVASIFDPGPDGANIADAGPVAIVAAIRDAVRRGPVSGMGDDDRCADHGAGPVDGTSHPGFTGAAIYVDHYACGCAVVDASGDGIDAAR